MNNLTNALDTMLHVHQADSQARSETSWQRSLPHVEEQALHTIEHCVHNFGKEAMQELEERVEVLQEEFLAHVNSVLGEKNIRLDEKLVFSLCAEDTLLLQCQEQDEALLAALGEDSLLRSRLQELRAMAFLIRGLQYMQAAGSGNIPAHLAEYHINVKGKLSHFYLR